MTDISPTDPRLSDFLRTEAMPWLIDRRKEALGDVIVGTWTLPHVEDVNVIGTVDEGKISIAITDRTGRLLMDSRDTDTTRHESATE